MGGVRDIGALQGGWYADRVELVNAAVSRIHGAVTYGLQAGGFLAYGTRVGTYRIEGSRFEQCGTVLQGNEQSVADCRFERLTQAAIAADRITCVRCVFAENEANWALGNRMGVAVELIDCEIGPARQPLQLRKNTLDPMKLLAQKAPVYPFYLERRSCVAEVRDETGAPIARAVVSLRCPVDPWRTSPYAAAVRRGIAVTGPDGRTPARMEDGALLVATRRLQATDDPLQPREDPLAYELTVDAAGFRGVRGPVPVTALEAPLPVRLERVAGH